MVVVACESDTVSVTVVVPAAAPSATVASPIDAEGVTGALNAGSSVRTRKLSNELVPPLRERSEAPSTTAPL